MRDYDLIDALPTCEDKSSEPFPGGMLRRVENTVDGNGRPLGGCVLGTGLAIRWQSGPTRVVGFNSGDGPQYIYERNGAFVEDVLIAARSRLEFYQRSEYACEANNDALVAINQALNALAKRREDRVDREVYGTHER